MTSLISTLLQGLNPGKSRFAFPYDSTKGVNNWFYLFALAVVLFLIVGVLKTFWMIRNGGRSILENGLAKESESKVVIRINPIG